MGDSDCAAIVDIPSCLGPFETRREIVVPVNADGRTTVKDVLLYLSRESHPWFGYLLDGVENPDGVHMLVLNSSMVHPKDQATTAVKPGDWLHIIPPILGG